MVKIKKLVLEFVLSFIIKKRVLTDFEAMVVLHLFLNFELILVSPIKLILMYKTIAVFISHVFSRLVWIWL